MGVGETKPLTVTIVPENASDKSYTWSSSNPAVASVENDLLTARTVGEVTITATSNDGGHTATCAVIVSDAKIIATGAGGYNLGDQWFTGSDNIILYLTTGSVTSSGLSLEGEGTALWLDTNAPKTGNMAIPAGTYTALLEEPGAGESQDFTFLPGVDMGAWGVVGAFIYQRKAGASDAELIMVEDGTVLVTVSGSTYTVNATVVAGGKNYEFSYSGAITVTDGTGGGGGDDDKYEIVEMKNLAKGEMGFYGQAYGTGMGSNYNNWMIYLADATFDLDQFTGTGELLQLEINTAGSVTREITPGTYEVFTEFGPNSFSAFSAVPGFVQDGAPYGTWYIKDKTALYGATSGTAKVSKSGSNYTIEFEFKDDEATKPTIFKGSYTGPLSFYDYTKSSASVKKAPAKSARKVAVPTVPRRNRFYK